jgi:hypothetical protein
MLENNYFKYFIIFKLIEQEKHLLYNIIKPKCFQICNYKRVKNFILILIVLILNAKNKFYYLFANYSRFFIM